MSKAQLGRDAAAVLTLPAAMKNHHKKNKKK
jgi:hypothetical protein